MSSPKGCESVAAYSAVNNYDTFKISGGSAENHSKGHHHIGGRHLSKNFLQGKSRSILGINQNTDEDKRDEVSPTNLNVITRKCKGPADK